MADNFGEKTFDGEMEVIETGYTPPSDKETMWMYEYEESIYLSLMAQLMGGLISHDKHKGVVVKLMKGAKPLMNQEGIGETMSFVKPFISKLQGLTAVKEERVLLKCKFFARALASFFALNMKRFNLTEEKADMVVDAILDMYEFNLSKSIDAMSMKAQGQMERHIETKQTQSKGLLRKFG